MYRNFPSQLRCQLPGVWSTEWQFASQDLRWIVGMCIEVRGSLFGRMYAKYSMERPSIVSLQNTTIKNTKNKVVSSNTNDQKKFTKKLPSYEQLTIPTIRHLNHYITSTLHHLSHYIPQSLHYLNHYITLATHHFHCITSIIALLESLHHINHYTTSTIHHFNITSLQSLHHLSHYITWTLHHLNHYIIFLHVVQATFANW
jgi:hypothetical protein